MLEAVLWRGHMLYNIALEHRIILCGDSLARPSVARCQQEAERTIF